MIFLDCGTAYISFAQLARTYCILLQIIIYFLGRKMKMKITCDRQNLTDAINAVSRAVSPKSSIPALEGILVTAGDSVLRISAYNLEIGIECEIPAMIEKKGGIVLQGRTFSEIIRKQTGAVVAIDVDDSLKANINCGNSEFMILGTPADEFPDIPKAESGDIVKIPQNILKQMIRQTVFSVSQSEVKPILRGCLFTVSGNDISIVAVDGRRIAVRKEKIIASSEGEYKFVVPGKTLGEVAKLISDSDTDVSLTVGTKQILFKHDNITVSSRLLEGEFLNYESALPKTCTTTAIINTSEVAGAAERIALIISDPTQTPIRMKFDTAIKLYCQTTLGKANDIVEAKISGDELEIGFNQRLLQDALNGCEEEEVVLEFAGPVSPMSVKPVDGSDRFLYLVLPVRLKSE